MKKDIHPEYKIATVKCVCGNEFRTRSTLDEISVEICSACHPFFTGQQKLVDSAGRVERFMRKYGDEYAARSGGESRPAAPAARQASESDSGADEDVKAQTEAAAPSGEDTATEGKDASSE